MEVLMLGLNDNIDSIISSLAHSRKKQWISATAVLDYDCKQQYDHAAGAIAFLAYTK